jgi:hypothetical protein
MIAAGSRRAQPRAEPAVAPDRAAAGGGMNQVPAR